MTEWKDAQERSIIRAVLKRSYTSEFPDGDGFEATYTLSGKTDDRRLFVMLRVPNDERHQFLREHEEYEFSLNAVQKEEWQL